MKSIYIRTLVVVCLLLMRLIAPANALTTQELEYTGWKLVFDGKNSHADILILLPDGKIGVGNLGETGQVRSYAFPAGLAGGWEFADGKLRVRYPDEFGVLEATIIDSKITGILRVQSKDIVQEFNGETISEPPVRDPDALVINPKWLDTEKGTLKIGVFKSYPGVYSSFADEDHDFNVAATSKPKRDPSGPTPLSIPGARVIKAAELKEWQNERKDLLLLDVFPSLDDERQSIPDAFWLPGAGNGNLDDAQRTRMLSHLESLAGDKNRPLIFFCGGVECWHSYNAALYAVEAGYTNVIWFRGGMRAWSAAKFPKQTIKTRQWWLSPIVPHR